MSIADTAAPQWEKVEEQRQDSYTVWRKQLSQSLWLMIYESRDSMHNCRVVAPNNDGHYIILTAKTYPLKTSHEELCKNADDLYKKWRKEIAKTILTETAKFKESEQDGEPTAVSWETLGVAETASMHRLYIDETHLLRVFVYHPPMEPQEGCVEVSIMKKSQDGECKNIVTWRALGNYNESEAKDVATALAVRWAAEKCLTTMDWLRNIVCGRADQITGSWFFTPTDMHITTQKKIKETLELTTDIGYIYVEED